MHKLFPYAPCINTSQPSDLRKEKGSGSREKTEKIDTVIREIASSGSRR